MHGNIDEKLPQDAADLGTTTVTAWDPYDVWLNRVKKPRDGRAATEVAVAATVVDSTAVTGPVPILREVQIGT